MIDINKVKGKLTNSSSGNWEYKTQHYKLVLYIQGAEIKYRIIFKTFYLDWGVHTLIYISLYIYIYIYIYTHTQATEVKLGMF